MRPPKPVSVSANQYIGGGRWHWHCFRCHTFGFLADQPSAFAAAERHIIESTRSHEGPTC